MKITIAIDSFKGSISSLQAGYAAKKGILDIYPDAVVSVCTLADGGEGTATALTEDLNGQMQYVDVTGPLGNTVKGFYGIIDESQTAIIEMAAAAGITLVEENLRNPLNTTTYGVGELILDAAKKGCRNFIIGIGGSATNDGGIGMLTALGFAFLDSNGNNVSFYGKGLADIAAIDDSKVNPLLKNCNFKIACDVTNPLCGENGCSAVFGPQKGATEQIVKDMDTWLSNFADIAKQKYPNADKNFAGAGAAGGLGFAFMTFLGSKLQSGVQIVLEETKLEEKIKNSDIVITGEGRLDSQTVMGKAPIGVAKLAKKYGKPVIAFSGCVTPDADVCNEHGIDAFFPIVRSAVTLSEALNTENAKRNMESTVKQVFNLINLLK